MKRVNVLVVDDSPSMRLMLNHALELDARIEPRAAPAERIKVDGARPVKSED